MISTAYHINKLDALRKYMDVWVEERRVIALIFEIYNVGGNLFNFPLVLPPFETWYELYLTTNN